MKKLILLVLLIPTLCFAQPGSTPDPTWTKEKNDDFKIVMMSDFVICRSPKVVIHTNTRMDCESGPTTKADLFNFYSNGFRLVQVVKSPKDYVYYLEKENKRLVDKNFK
jgi:hypothetical protein